MTEKATHEELKQRVKELEKEAFERERMDETLSESNERHRRIFDTVPVSIILIDKDGQMLDINSYHLSHIVKGKLTKEDLIGKNIVTHPTIVNAGLSETYKGVLEGEPFDQQDVYFPTLMTGGDGYFNVKGVPLLKDGEVTGAITIHEDIAERRHAEKQLRASEERYRRVVEDMPVLICRFLLNGTLSFVNSFYCRYFGKTYEELVGNNFFQFIPEEDREKVQIISNTLLQKDL